MNLHKHKLDYDRYYIKNDRHKLLIRKVILFDV